MIIQENKEGQKKILYKIGGALLTVFSILSLFLILYSEFEKSMVQSIGQFSNEFVEQVDTISGTLLDIIQNTGMQIYYTSSVKTLRTKETLTNAQRTSGLRDLGNFTCSSEFLMDAMVYNEKLNCIFTSDGGHTSLKSEEFYDQSAMNLLLHPEKQKRMVPVHRTSNRGECYTFVFYEVRDKGKRDALLLDVKAKWYEKQLLGISSGDNCVILNDKGEGIASGSKNLLNEAEKLWPLLCKELELKKGKGGMIKEDEKTSWIYHKLRNSGWIYVKKVGSETIYSSMGRLRNVVYFVFLLILLALFSSMVYILIKVYMPFQILRKALGKIGDDHRTLPGKIDLLLENQFEQQMSMKMKHLLEEGVGEEIQTSASLIITDYKESESLRSFIQLRYETILIAHIEIGSAIIIPDLWEADINKLCGELAEKYHRVFYYGRPRKDKEGIQDSYKNLCELHQMHFLFSREQVMPESLIENFSQTSGFDEKQAEALFSALRMGQLKEAREGWKQIFNSIQRDHFVDFRFAVRYVTKGFASLQKEFDLSITLPPKNILEGIKDVQELNLAVDACMEALSCQGEQRKKEKLDIMAQQVEKCIREEYEDSNLSAQHIADKMGMNYVYLGRLFKQSTGKSISEVINNIRIEKAKADLVETQDSIENIAQKVGFNNTKYFYVIFKNHEGITPKQFRHQGEKN
ncbi:MAG: helix-turn-helix transcriptional regulator [Acetivibrio sp.]